MNKNENTKNNILSFQQPAEFFVKKAEKHIDAGNFLQALHLYRKVLGMEPRNTDYLLNIAQIYSEMGLYSESNEVLHKIIRNGETPTECLFALGCNYMGMKKYHLADEAFEQYLEIDPDGEYAGDIEDIFGYYDEEDSFDDSVLLDVNYNQLLDQAYDGKEFLDRGEYTKAIERLEGVVAQNGRMHSAANNLSLSYFFSGDKQKAIATAEKVLESEPANLHACCNLAMFFSESGNRGKALEYIDKLSVYKDIEPTDMHKVALTYCELGFHKEAHYWFARLVTLQPYDVRILHFCGLAAYNCGNYKESLSCFNKVLKICPENCLAQYYKDKAEKAKKNGGGIFEYVYQVQFSEIKKRIKYLNDCLKQNADNLMQMWKDDEYFQSIILWGLHFGDEYIKKIVLEIMSIFADDKVEEEYRDFLLKSSEPDDIKNDVFLYLKRMGAEEPYVAYIKGAIAEVRVGNVSEDIEKLPRKYAEALGLFIPNARVKHKEHLLTSGIEILVTLAKNDEDDGAWVRSTKALAAAIEYCVYVLDEIEQSKTKKELCEKYGTTHKAFNRCFNKIKELFTHDE